MNIVKTIRRVNRNLPNDLNDSRRRLNCGSWMLARTGNCPYAGLCYRYTDQGFM